MSQSRIVHLPDLFPRKAYSPGSSIYYLSWPSWEKCISSICWDNPKSPPPIDFHLTAALAPEAKPLTIEGPESFLNSLAILLEGMDKVSFQDSIMPFASGFSGPESQKGILAALDPQDKNSTFSSKNAYSHLAMAIFTLKILSASQANDFIADANMQEAHLFSELLKPDLAGAHALLESPSPIALSDPYKELSDYQANWILKTWFDLASPVLKKGDLLYPPTFFLSFLSDKFPQDRNAPGVLIYEGL